jgi:hypothetical protein
VLLREKGSVIRSEPLEISGSERMPVAQGST